VSINFARNMLTNLNQLHIGTYVSAECPEIVHCNHQTVYFDVNVQILGYILLCLSLKQVVMIPVCYSEGPLLRWSAILNLAAVCASIYHTNHIPTLTLTLTLTLFLTLNLTLTLILVGIADLWNSGPVLVVIPYVLKMVLPIKSDAYCP